MIRSKRPTHTAVLLAMIAAVTMIAAACAPLPEPPPATGTNVVVAGSISGFDRPWDLAFTPDGTPLVTERPGRIVTVDNGVRVVVGAIGDVVAKGEGGLLGLAVDPGFSSNRFIYTCYASGVAGVVNDVRVVRFKVATDYRSLSGQTPLLTGIPSGAGNRHLGCRVEVGPDGYLWVTTGDAATGVNPADPTKLAGKTLRMTTAGAPAPGNPGGAWNPYVFSIGHRNPQGLAFRPADGVPFEVEHGTFCDDEVNRLVVGGDFGWDPNGIGGFYDETKPMTKPGGIPAAWSSGCPTIAPSGAAFVTDPMWGPRVGQLAVAVLKASRLTFMTISGDVVIDTEDRLTDQGRLRTVRQAPDGSLWVVQDASPGSILRIVPG